MTGFGRSEGQIGDKKVTVELRSLNSKQLDLQVKLPSAWREKEAEVRQWAGEMVVRGKAELAIGFDGTQAQKRTSFNAALIKMYYDELRDLAGQVAPDASTDLLGMVLRMPEVTTATKEEQDPAEWEAVMTLAEQAAARFDEFRAAEGAKLEAELAGRTRNISGLLEEVAALDGGRIGRVRERVLAKLEELRAKVDQDRFEQELVFYIEKLDVTEEKLRLATHCNYFLETLSGREGQGRKLAFIAQEMGREINTLGSKANDADIQKLVVRMKDELEKIKEQVLNVL